MTISLRSKLAALAFGCLVSALLLECLLRIYNPFYTQVHSSDLWLRRAKVETQRVNAPGLDSYIVIHRNSLGFRGPAPPERFSEYLTILTIGGSTTECSLQDDNRTWPALLAGHLNRSLRNVWLNNAGILGHSTFGHIILLENYVIKLRPKVAVFLVGCNDPKIVAPRPGYDDIRHRQMRFSSVGAIASSLAQYSEAVACIYTVGHYLKVGSRAWGALDAGFRLLPPRYLYLSDTDIGRVKQAHRDIYLPGYRARLLKIAGLCRGSGIEPVFVTQPYLLGEGKDERTGVDLALFESDPGSNGRMDWEVLEMYNDAVRALAQEQAVPVIDLARQMAKSSRYFYDETHYTNEGAELVARLIYVELNEWLKRRFPEYAREPGSSGSDVTRTQPELRVR